MNFLRIQNSLDSQEGLSFKHRFEKPKILAPQNHIQLKILELFSQTNWNTQVNEKEDWRPVKILAALSDRQWWMQI